METLECLYLEDNDHDYATFRQIFERALKPTQLNVHRVTRSHDAIQALTDGKRRFQVFFADLLIKDEDGADESAEGLNAVEEAVQLNVVTIAISKAEGSQAGIRERFTQRGGHLYLDKRHLKGEKDVKGVRLDIERVLRRHGIRLGADQDPILDTGENTDINLDAEIETIGEASLRALLRQIDPQITRFQPYYVAPGASGAIVLRIDGRDISGRLVRSLLLKCARDRVQLARELTAVPDVGAPSSPIYVPYAGKEPWEDNGWFAIAARFEDQATTLQHWLVNSRHSEQDVSRLFEELFVTGLGPAYKQRVRREESTAPEVLLPSLRSRARILRSLETLEGLIAMPKVSGRLSKGRRRGAYEAGVVARRFLNSKQIGAGRRSIPKGTSECWSHGDLHTRNVLVSTPHSRPWLIDTGNRRHCHWATDFARLSADLWMTCWNSGAESFFWDRLPQWRRDVTSWRSEQVIRAAEPDQAVLSALTWIRRNLQVLFQELPMWEFDVAFAMELLAMSAYPDVAPPKRCLGVLTAEDVLRDLEEEIS